MSGELTSQTKGWLVDEAETLLEKVKMRDGFNGQTSQLRNMVQITQTECEIAVLRNFIHYQVGRKSTSAFWSLIHEDVLRVLEGIAKKHEQDEVRLTAIQSFFGYLVRHYVYLTWINRQNRSPRPRR